MSAHLCNTTSPNLRLLSPSHTSSPHILPVWRESLQAKTLFFHLSPNTFSPDQFIPFGGALYPVWWCTGRSPIRRFSADLQSARWSAGWWWSESTLWWLHTALIDSGYRAFDCLHGCRLDESLKTQKTSTAQSFFLSLSLSLSAHTVASAVNLTFSLQLRVYCHRCSSRESSDTAQIVVPF